MRKIPYSPNLSQLDTLIYSAYYAPRGRQRLYMVARDLCTRYVYPTDLLVGIIGAEGSGKSTLIKGMFPGLELTNDDDGVNLRPTPIYDFSPEDFFTGHTFHIDARYEMAFHSKFEVCEAVTQVIMHGRRVVVEHFDLISDSIEFNAHILFGVGEEIIVVRPNVFGPLPAEIKQVVDRTIKYRLMSHSAEDITSYILAKDYHFKREMLHSDIKHGFVIKFPSPPDIDLNELEAKVKKVIAKDVPIGPLGEDQLAIGKWKMYCTGTRTHVKSSGLIENFHLKKAFIHNPLTKEYLLVGIVGNRETTGLDDIAYVQE